MFTCFRNESLLCWCCDIWIGVESMDNLIIWMVYGPRSHRVIVPFNRSSIEIIIVCSFKIGINLFTFNINSFYYSYFIYVRKRVNKT